MKKLIALALVFIFAFTLLSFDAPIYAAVPIWDGSVAAGFSGGSGTEQDPYLISNGAELAAIKSNSYYKLTADIYLNDTANWEQWETSAPINVWRPSAFSNLYLDGAEHTIYGLYTQPVSNYNALIQQLNGGYIRNLTISQSLIQGNDYCGGFAGYMRAGTIDHCSFEGKLSVNGYGCAGICGDARGENSVIKNCTNKGYCLNTLNNEDEAYRFAGIVGQATDGAAISYCINEGKIQSFATQTGGVVGHAYTNVLIDHCENRGEVLVTGAPDYMTNIGGIAGGMYDNVTLSNCTNYGTVSSYSRVAGIAGSVGTNCSVISCVNYGAVNASSYQNGGVAGGIFEGALVDRCINYGNVAVSGEEDCQGGVVGFANTSSVKNCINFGNVTAKDCYGVGGILGDGYGYGEGIYNCYNIGRIEGIDGVGGIVGSAGESYAIHGVMQAGEVYGVYHKGLVVGDYDSNITLVTGWYNSDLKTLSSLQNDIGTFEPVAETVLKSQSFVDMVNGWLAERQTKLTGFYQWALGDDSTFDYPKLSGEAFPVVRKADEYKINSLVVSDLKGDKLSSLPAQKVLVTISITKLIDVDDTVLFLGAYSADGQFEGLMWAEIEDLSQNGTLKITLPFDNTAGKATKLKAYMIGSFAEPMPLGGLVEFGE